MYAEERQQSIADLVRRTRRVSVTDLAAQYDVTTETVRRDLSALERVGVLRRVHGGAVPTESVIETRLSDRDQANAAEKGRIAAAAASLIPPDNASVLLDAGSTVGRLADQLPRDRPLRVFTHSLTVATKVAALDNAELHLLPGRVRGTTQAAVGSETVAALALVHADVVFLATNGMSLRAGLTTPDPEEAAAKRALVGAGARVVLLADASKAGQVFTVRFADLAQVDTLITDDRITDEALASYESAGIEVIRA